MDTEAILARTEICSCCLAYGNENNIEKYDFKVETLKIMFSSANLFLCTSCVTLARDTETFIQNVQAHQTLMGSVLWFNEKKIQAMKSNVDTQTNVPEYLQPLSVEKCSEGIYVADCSFNQSTQTLKTNMNVQPKLPEFVNPPAEDKYSREIYETDYNVDIKSEMKEEMNSEGDSNDDNDGDIEFKIENDEDLKSENESEVPEKKSLKRKKHKVKGVKLKKDSSENKLKRRVVEPKVKIIYISRKECMADLAERAKDPQYVQSPYKCETCVKGFTFEAAYQRHMEKHDKSAGKVVCVICKQRMETESQLSRHTRFHYIRYKCPECDFSRVSRYPVADHYRLQHLDSPLIIACPHCNKLFKRNIALKRHISYAHRPRTRIVCKYCQKSYMNKQTLRAHITSFHELEEASLAPPNSHKCPHCGKGFKAPSLMRKHLLSHTDKKEFYCVECDRSFKSDATLKNHLKTATPHVSYQDLPLQCEHCPKRFAIRRDVERHTNSMHLHNKPYQCDKCDKAYVSKWSLKEHISLAHEGYKRPLNFPCTMCDRVFDRKQILVSHIRTHTGERPYECKKCSAKFTQSSVLRTHDKLIHLNQGRDGLAKNGR